MRGDPLDSLHEAWRDLDPPSPHTSEDELTRAAVEWLRGAWETLEAPTLELPLQLPLQLPVARPAVGRAEPQRTLRLLPLAAAVAAGWLLFVLWLAGPGREVAGEIAAAPEEELPAMHATLRDDGSVELRSGVVRLVLMDRPQITNPDTNPDPNPRVRNTTPRTTEENR